MKNHLAAIGALLAATTALGTGPRPAIGQKMAKAEQPATETEVLIPTADGRVKHLAGTLYLPAGKGPHPAVVQVQGSGPTDRHWNSVHIKGGDGTGRVLARHIAQAGMAVLAFDKRGSGSTPADPDPQLTTPIEDVEAAFDYLRGREEIDGTRVALMGHSEGAGLCLRAALRRQGVAALVMLSGGGRSGRTILHEQVAGNILAPSHVDEKEARRNHDYLDAVLTAILADAELPEQPEGLHPDVVKLAEGLAAKRSMRGCGPCGIAMNEEPAAYAARLAVPLMVAGGGHDAHVGRADFDALRKAAPMSVGLFVEDMDHLLKVEERSPEGVKGEELLARYAEPRPVHPKVLRAVEMFLSLTLQP